MLLFLFIFPTGNPHLLHLHSSSCENKALNRSNFVYVVTPPLIHRKRGGAKDATWSRGMEVEVVSRKKKFSKKGKKNWRKHADVKDVEEYLEGRRREEIFG